MKIDLVVEMTILVTATDAPRGETWRRMGKDGKGKMEVLDIRKEILWV